MSDEQIHWARKRLDSFKNAPAETMMVSPVNNNMFKVYDMFWDVKKDEFTSGAILFVGMPSSSISSVALSNQIDLDKGVLDLRIEKIDDAFPGVSFDEQTKSFLLNYRIKKEFVDEALAQEIPPTTFEDLVTSIKYEAPGQADAVPGSDIIFESNNPTETRARLTNILESFVLKNMYQEVTGFSLNEEMIQIDPVDSRSTNTIPLASLVMKPIQDDKQKISSFFISSGQDIKFPGAPRLDALTQPQLTELSGTAAWSDPSMSMEEVETLYSLYGTVPFFDNRIDQAVLSNVVFDRVVGMFIDVSGFDVDVQESFQNTFKDFSSPQESGADWFHMIPNPKSGKMQWHLNQGALNNTFSLPTLYISADMKEST